MTPEEKLLWYERRCKALEDLLVKFRVGGYPSERLHKELERTNRYIDSFGKWKEGA
jgi:hypothetical protein